MDAHAFQLAAGFYYLNASYYYMQCVQKHKVVKRPWRARRWWMRTIHKNRNKESMENFFQEMLADPSNEFNFCRMSITDFEFLLQKLDPIISKKNTKWRDSIPSKIRLAVTLRFLASGDSYKSLHFTFKISSQIISKIVIEVCAALYQVLKEEIKLPVVEENWLAVESGFHQRFPHCVGAIDGKHVVLQSPMNSGTEYYNYKRSFSIVLMVLVNSNYCFMFADVGCQGRISDGSVFKNSFLWHKMCNNLLRLPAPNPLENGNPDAHLPYVFLGDGAFALHNNLMKPYPGLHQEGTKEKIFNKKLSTARVVIENVFGILSAVFRVLRKPLLLEPEPAIKVVMACIVLHNFLRKSRHSSHTYNPPGTFDIYDGDDLIVQGSWRADIPVNPALRNISNIPRRSTRNPTDIRDEFANYFYH